MSAGHPWFSPDLPGITRQSVCLPDSLAYMSPDQTQPTRVTQDRPAVMPFRMITPRLAKAALRVSGGLCVGALSLLAPLSPASAQGRLDARYEATLAGIPVGKGTWTIDISDDQFSSVATGGTS